MTDDRQTERERQLPEDEYDDPATVGGGLMSSGGTAVDRGTGELSGTAEGPGADEDEDETTEGLVNDVGTPGVIAAGPPGGGTTPYVAGYIEERDRDDHRADRD